MVNHINKFMQRMQYSRHTCQYRAQIANSALKAYENIQEIEKGRWTHVQVQELEKKWQTTEEKGEKVKLV